MQFWDWLKKLSESFNKHYVNKSYVNKNYVNKNYVNKNYVNKKLSHHINDY